MKLADTTAHAEQQGWTVTPSKSSIAGLTLVQIENPTHLIFSWWTTDGGLFHSAQLLHANEFEAYLSTTSDNNLLGWVCCHAHTRLEAAS